MGIATWVEKDQGTSVASETFYHSGWFVLLWGVTAITGFFRILQTGLWRKIPSLLLHLSFLLILTGSLLTHLTSLHGRIHLRKGIPEHHFMAQTQRFWESSQSRSFHKLPYSLTLEEFSVVTYPGTQAPADYVSQVRLTFPDGTHTDPLSISMNHILQEKGYRFYQSSFDPDHHGTILAINYDPYGVPVTYTGYALLVLAMLLLLVDPAGTFRRLLRHPALKTISAAVLVGFLPSALQAQSEDSDSVSLPASQILRIPKRVLPEELALQIGQLQVLYNDRIAPLQTLARDFSLKVSGKVHYKGLHPEQVLCGWIFCPEQWQYEPLIKIKNKELATLLQTESPAPLVAFFGPDRAYKLRTYWSQLHQGGNPTPLQKAITEADEKVQLILMLEEGNLLKLFPLNTNGRVNWYSPTDSLPPSTPIEKVRFIRGMFTLLYEAILQEKDTTASELIQKLSIYQHREGGKTLLSDSKVKAELCYNRFEPTTWLYRICLTVGLIGFLLLGANPARKKRAAQEKTETVLLGLVFLCLTATVFLRSYIAGRFPMSNGYETMLFLSWVIQLTALILGRKVPVATTFGFLLSGFTLLVSTLGQMNPQITPLMPVLLSPWLSLHVSLIMTAYALYAFTFLCGITATLFHFQRRTKEVERLTVLSRLLLYPATFLLGAGIFVGAVWANVSWGTYWSWDPKEVWALISFLVYAIPMHDRSLPFFKHPLGYHVYISLAFSTLLMTYFGVNYFLGGMHSYAG